MHPARLTFVLVALAALAAASPRAIAAVRLCKAGITTDEFKGASELEARKAAVDRWKARALEHGPGYDSFRIAAGKDVKCRVMAGAHYCAASGSPCLISQVAPSAAVRAPDDQLLQARGLKARVR